MSGRGFERSRVWRRTRLAFAFVAALVMSIGPGAAHLHARELTDALLPEFVDAAHQRAVERGLAYLASVQARDGGVTGARDGIAYPVSMTALAGMAFLASGSTPTRGPWAEQIRGAQAYILQMRGPNGLITGPTSEQNRAMYGHGFGMMFLGSLYGMETRPRVRERMREMIEGGIVLISKAQSPAGGWYYMPGTGDEGSVTVTQIQALRAVHLAGFPVPEGTIRGAIEYLEKCRTPEGGIRYSLNSGPQTRLPISAAAVATLYNAGDYDSDMADACLEYVHRAFRDQPQWSKGGGHAYYAHYYASQAFYQAGDSYWRDYYPQAAKQLIEQQGDDGAWQGDGIGPVYGTSMALVILQLPYRYLPIYQR